MRLILTSLLAIFLVCSAKSPLAQEQHELASMPLRAIGPALTSGRVSDFAFHPTQRQIHYVAMASGGVWKTENDGITWTSVFSDEGSYAVGVVELDPSNPKVVWVGTGENNSQRSVGYGDGVYRSLDGGKSWTNMGLKDSGHISMIRFDPRDSQTMYVAAQGPLWNSGGDRGLYRSRNGGESWEKVLDIDPDTGINEFLIHPAQPDTMVASSYQRRRHVWTLINGGPGGGIHKTTDGGATWRKLSRGLPKGDLGRIGLAAAPSAPNVVYAIVEADPEQQGVYRSTDFGESWEKRSDYMASSPQYYNELIVDPHNPERVYSMDTFARISEDGGKTWSRLSIKNKHVDDHALWIDPDNTDHIYIGSDGGVYESWDRGQTWRHVRNLPVAQFYRATPDNDEPFYNVCAGTQDNHTLCGPSRTRYTDGITNGDWWIAQFGDGFKAQIDPTDANVVYAQYQYGGLVRFDRITGERLSITPRPPEGELNYNWNWNAPLIISPHDHRRLYYGAERLFRSDDRGESWTVVSEDLSRDIDRNRLDVMGRVWSVDAISKNRSTSIYGALIALDESNLQEGLIYAGTDDGLIHVTEDGGGSWRTVDSFRGVPDMSLIEDIVASRQDADVAYATIDNHKRGDFKPYVLKTEDRGRSWKQIGGGLPERGSAHTLAEDHVNPELLFVGTEFGVFFSPDGGGAWHELTGLPTIAVRDLEIQRRESDLVIGTFGLGVYILDDYSPLRTGVTGEATLFAVRDAWLFVPDDRRGWGGKGDYGTGRYSAENPPHGAVVSYHLAEGLKTLKETRREDEKARAKDGEDNPYPSWDALRQEDREQKPAIVVTVRDADGNVIRRLDGPTGKGFHRVAWDLRYPAPDPINLNGSGNRSPWQSPPRGPLVVPGEYQVSLAKREQGELVPLAGPVSFRLKPMFEGGLITDDRQAVLDFQQKTAALSRAVRGAGRALGELDDRVEHLHQAITATPAAEEQSVQALLAIRSRLQDLQVRMTGDQTLASRSERTPMSIAARVGDIIGGHWESQSSVTGTHRDSYDVAARQFETALGELRAVAGELERLESELEGIGAPWTPGRIPDWQMN